MKEILLNLALIDLIRFCKEQKIDCSDTKVLKNGRGYNYSLVNNQTGRSIVTVMFTKHSVPTHYVHSNF